LAFHAEAAFEVDPNVAIAKLSPELKSELWRPDTIGMPPVTPWDFATAKFAVIGRYTSSSPVQGDFAFIMPKVERLVLAMRLLKPGGVYAEVAFDTLEYPYLASARTTTPQAHLRARHDHHDYILNPEDIPTLLALYTMLTQASVGNPLEVATSRFQQTYTRDRPEDRVIDLTIALESTLLYDVRGELAFRLSLRGAMLLSDSYPPDYTFSLLQALYNARSKIVHEGATLFALSTKSGLIANLGVDKFVADVTQWVRTGIRRYLYRLSDGESLAAIGRALDREIIRGISQRSSVTGAPPG
jgi:hypothetical protein